MKSKNNIILSISIIVLFISSVSFLLAKKNSFSCADNVKSFLIWYKNNLENIEKLEKGMVQKNKEGYYQVDFDGKDKYVSLLKSSGYVSDSFFSKLDEYVKSQDINLKEKKQKDGIPEGFDLNFIFWAENYKHVFEKLPNSIEIQETDTSGKKFLIEKEFNLIFNSSCQFEANGK